MVERFIVEYDTGDWLLMDPNGSIHFFNSPDNVLRAIKRRARARISSGAKIHVAEVEWRKTPAGFIPPETTIPLDNPKQLG